MSCLQYFIVEYKTNIFLHLLQVSSRDFAVQATATAAGTQKEAMEKHEVVPDVIQKAPAGTVDVNYGTLGVKLGNVLTPTQVQNPPTVTWTADPSKFYLLCMTGMYGLWAVYFICKIFGNASYMIQLILWGA